MQVLKKHPGFKAVQNKTTLGSGRAMGTKSFGALLGIANALEASKGRR